MDKKIHSLYDLYAKHFLNISFKTAFGIYKKRINRNIWLPDSICVDVFH